ncbi:MacB family efflux pump subunit [Cardiobacterium valvarum]|uniref:Pyoverdine export ATP-binding/permease protein PvdT n=1 Tax=Cardiobacterium valvarum TaxID=194702 RepID=A0A381EEY8_9GAMM|nr:MacB family efflux pump subunit [Cardiobacterium valvarum]SUX25337.1 Macrolide export ATP-binding/permease protein MacB [Cardiobacterium valvarum]
MAEPLIRIKNLYRRFKSGEGEVTILNDLNLEIEAGEMVAIIGQSGSGKSTLMNILGCLDRPSAGEYYINGKNATDLSPQERAALRREYIGFIFQRYHLLADLKAWENVAIPAIYAGTDGEAREKRAKALLTRLGLGERTEHKPGQLSGGQQQRVSIARALMNGGQIIFADEPTGALDSHSGEEVMKILGELHAEGHTIILVTHDRHIAGHADRIIEIKDGKIIADHRQQGDTAEAGKTDTVPTGRKTAFGAAGRFTSAIHMAWRAILGHKLRAFLTMLGIIIGIASVVSVVALGQGAQQQVLDQISDLGSSTIEIFPGRFGDRRAARIRTLVPADADILAQQSFIDSATPTVNASPTIRHGNKDYTGNLTGVGEQYFQVQNIPITAGRAFSARDINDYAALAILDKKGAETLYNSSEADNYANAIGQTLLLNNVPVRIVGIADTEKQNRFGGSNSINLYMPYTSAMNRLLGRNNVSGITLRISDDADPVAAEDAITRILTRRHGSQDFSLFNSDSLRKAITGSTQVFTLLISAIAAIALVVGGIGVMNIMLVSVTERTQEIGIRMAVGARQGDILMQFLIEALMLCLLGGALGIALAYGIGWVFNQSGAEIHLIYSTSSVIAAVICSSTIGILFGYLPARNAARLDPVEALSRE